MYKHFQTMIAKNTIDEFDSIFFWKNNCYNPYLAELSQKYLFIPLTITSIHTYFDKREAQAFRSRNS